MKQFLENQDALFAEGMQRDDAQYSRELRNVRLSKRWHDDKVVSYVVSNVSKRYVRFSDYFQKVYE